MVGREIPLIAFDGYYPRFMGEAVIGQRTKQKAPQSKSNAGLSFKNLGRDANTEQIGKQLGNHQNDHNVYQHQQWRFNSIRWG